MIRHLTPQAETDRTSAGGDRVRRNVLPAGLAAVQLVLAYEWFVSGINKVANPNFTLQLAGTLQDGLKGNPYGFYDSFLRTVILPHATVIGLLTEIGECAIGLTLLVSGLLWLWRPAARLTVYAGGAAAAALVGAAFLSLNYFLQGGSPLPWIDPANAFNEGVDIDILIPLIALVLAVANLRAVRAAARSFAAGRPSEEWLPWAS